jgi:transcription antitermination factor NusG
LVAPLEHSSLADELRRVACDHLFRWELYGGSLRGLTLHFSESVDTKVGLLSPKQPTAELGFRWYALHVHTRKEAAVAAHLEGQGLECFLPLYKSVRKWSDRVKELQQPLFPGYLFSRFDYQNRRAVVMTPSVLQVVGNGRTAIPVPDDEISAIQTAVASGLSHQPWPYIEVGERVRLTYGTLSGLEGILINFKGNHRVLLSVSLLQRSVAFEVDLAWLVPVRERRPVVSGGRVVQTSPVPDLIR